MHLIFLDSNEKILFEVANAPQIPLKDAWIQVDEELYSVNMLKWVFYTKTRQLAVFVYCGKR